MSKSIRIDYIIIVSTIPLLCIGAEAAPMWFFGGTCDDSTFNNGIINNDSKPIYCNVGILSMYKNERVLIQFNTKSGILGFAGSLLDRQANMENVQSVQVDTIHPEAGEQINRGVEGVCLIDNADFKHAKRIKCTVEYRNNNAISKYSIRLSVTQIDRIEMDER
jgi:hypothetical protein